MYHSLYRKYRPNTFNEVVGQDITVKTLINSINNKKISHAYLFQGPRGTGKTSIAKIFAKSINCEKFKNNVCCDKCVSCTQILQNKSLDIIEIDAASSNSVENVRNIITNVDSLPSYSKYKIYIIDEVHMFSIGAFNALLKTLEEPPNHVIFILATTDPQKIPETIISRCQIFEFKKISVETIYQQLKKICIKENINIEQSALNIISEFSNGGMRDAIGMLEQVIAYKNNNITISDIHDVNGTISQNEIKTFIINIFEKNISEILFSIDKFNLAGKNLFLITNQICLYLQNCVILLTSSEYAKAKQIYYSEYSDIVDKYEINRILDLLYNINDIYQKNKNSLNYQMVFEIEIIKIIELTTNTNISQNKNIQEFNDEKNISQVKTQNISQEINNNNNNNKTNFEQKSIKNIFNTEKYELFKNSRVNNTLSKFSKKEFKYLKDNFSLIESYNINQKNIDILSLILDGKIKAASEENIIIVYDNCKDSFNFNINLELIEQIFNEIYKKKYNLIGLSVDEWIPYKEKFNNKEKFVYKKEEYCLNDFLNIQKENNKIENLFNYLIEEE